MITKERLKELADKNTICKVSHEERLALATELLELRQQLGAIKPEQDDGWVEWGGGKWPVSESVKVQVMFRDGGIVEEEGQAGGYEWSHKCVGWDIIAYRVVS